MKTLEPLLGTVTDHLRLPPIIILITLLKDLFFRIKISLGRVSLINSLKDTVHRLRHVANRSEKQLVNFPIAIIKTILTHLLIHLILHNGPILVNQVDQIPSVTHHILRRNISIILVEVVADLFHHVRQTPLTILKLNKTQMNKLIKPHRRRLILVLHRKR